MDAVAARAEVSAAARAHDRRALRARALLLTPAVLTISGFLVLPLSIVLVYSFLTPGTFGGVVWDFSFNAYIQFLFERDFFDETLVFSTAYLQIYLRSFTQAAASTVLCFAIGFPTAYFIAGGLKSRLKGPS